MKRVAILQEYVPEYRVPFFKELADQCADHGISVSVHAGTPGRGLAPRSDAARDGPWSPVRQREFSVLGRRVTLRSTRQAVQGADVVVVEQARRNLDTYRLLLPRRAWLAVQVGMWGHGRDFVADRSRLETGLHARLTRRVDHFFAYTESGARHVETLGLDPSRITVVRNSVDSRAFQRQLLAVTDEDVAGFRQRYRLSPKTLLYVGALDQSKRLDLLLDAYLLAHRKQPELGLVILGDGEQRDRVEAFATDHPRVAYLGRLEGTGKALAFRAAMALSIPGRVGLVAVDSIASGVPILTTNWEFHAPEFEYLVPGTTVFTSDQSPGAYADLIATFIRSPQLRIEAARALRHQAPKFGVEVMAENFLRGIKAMAGS